MRFSLVVVIRHRFLAAALVGGGLLLASLAAVAGDSPVLRVCLNEQAHPPWRFAEADGRVRLDGLDFFYLAELGRRSGLKVDVQLKPWKRCLAELRGGEQDLILGISHLPEREEFAVYPQHRGAPDENLALRHERYHWYATKPAQMQWNGQRIVGMAPDALVGVQTGYSIAGAVRELGLKVDEGARTAEANLEKLVRARVQVAALQAREADTALARRRDLAQQVRRLDPPLQERAYYAAFSRPYWTQNPNQVLDLWRELARIRDSAAFRSAEAAALARMSQAAATPP